MRKLHTKIWAVVDWLVRWWWIFNLLSLYFTGLARYSALNIPCLCSDIKYIKCYFESNNPRGETFSKHEVGGSLPRGDRAHSRAFVLLDSEDMGLGVLTQVCGISVQLNKASGPLEAGRWGCWRNPGAFLSFLRGGASGAFWNLTETLACLP